MQQQDRLRFFFLSLSGAENNLDNSDLRHLRRS